MVNGRNLLFAIILDCGNENSEGIENEQSEFQWKLTCLTRVKLKMHPNNLVNVRLADASILGMASFTRLIDWRKPSHLAPYRIQYPPATGRAPKIEFGRALAFSVQASHKHVIIP